MKNHALERLAARVGEEWARRISAAAIALILQKAPDSAIDACIKQMCRQAMAEKRERAKESPETKIEQLKSELEDLERLPSNEAARFQILTEIYQLEQDGAVSFDEWPELIGGGE